MAKLCVLSLTSPGVKSEALKEDQTCWDVRDIELAVLKNLCLLAANAQKDHKKMNVCYDLVAEVESVTPDMIEFKINPSDLKEFIIPAIEKSADKRPDSWYFARKLFKHIEEPEMVEV